MELLRIHPADNVAVSLHGLQEGETAQADGFTLTAAQEIPQGHKIALSPIGKGENIIKYGCAIGSATADIAPGEWVHVHNVRTNLSEEGGYTYAPHVISIPQKEPETFQGYLREDGRAAVRNEIWILPTVGCVNGVAQRLARENAFLAGESREGRPGTIDGVYAFPHPFGCSQMGDDHAATRRLLAALANHPNAGGVLVLSLGCENNTLEGFQKELGEWDSRRVKFLVCQDVEDESAAGSALLEELARYAGGFARQPLPVSKLVIGMKCGGSDGLSGITANPAVGALSDMLAARGASTVLTEVPEMFGAESVLLNRCMDENVFARAAGMITDFKQYFTSHGQTVYENPSPGNKQGGITTLEDKSLGCVQKGGTAPVRDVIPYGGRVTAPGLTLLSGPGNDLVSTTALTAAGAHLILFTTGRGTPFGAPAPTLKIATNTPLYEKKRGWIDFNAGSIADGEPIAKAAQRLLEKAIATASGEKTCAEQMGYREISILKDGVVL